MLLSPNVALQHAVETRTAPSTVDSDVAITRRPHERCHSLLLWTLCDIKRAKYREGMMAAIFRVYSVYPELSAITETSVRKDARGLGA